MYRKISDLNSKNITKDVHNTDQNWTDIENVNNNDRYELTLIVFNNEDLNAETGKQMFPVGPGKQFQTASLNLNLQKYFNTYTSIYYLVYVSMTLGIFVA